MSPSDLQFPTTGPIAQAIKGPHGIPYVKADHLGWMVANAIRTSWGNSGDYNEVASAAIGATLEYIYGEIEHLRGATTKMVPCDERIRKMLVAFVMATGGEIYLERSKRLAAQRQQEGNLRQLRVVPVACRQYAVADESEITNSLECAVWCHRQPLPGDVCCWDVNRVAYVLVDAKDRIGF